MYFIFAKVSYVYMKSYCKAVKVYRPIIKLLTAIYRKRISRRVSAVA